MTYAEFVRRAKKVLEKVEWVNPAGRTANFCPCCDVQPVRKKSVVYFDHQFSCELDLLLKELPE